MVGDGRSCTSINGLGNDGYDWHSRGDLGALAGRPNLLFLCFVCGKKKREIYCPPSEDDNDCARYFYDALGCVFLDPKHTVVAIKPRRKPTDNEMGRTLVPRQFYSVSLASKRVPFSHYGPFLSP